MKDYCVMRNTLYWRGDQILRAQGIAPLLSDREHRWCAAVSQEETSIAAGCPGYGGQY